ncbi:MAG: hypothetical protein CVV36_05590 [Candidatus Methanoperedenaceae archaeon HGW-Methanoperedenaceae-1]|nr:MAG: hypothetical protein CVV36_05590 [Candidatus Methanoperedenaceae archaeon HGW-Methanoperedenaceae-1]
MSDFLDKFLKIRSGFFSRMKFLFILDLVTFSSILYAIFIILNAGFFLEKAALALPIPIKFIPPLSAFILALLASVLRHKKDKNINVTLLIEKKAPALNEKLRTAYDNRHESNVIIDSLNEHVSDLLMGVSSSQLLSGSRIVMKLLVTVIFIAGAATISSSPEYWIPVEKIEGAYTNLSDTLTGNNQTTGPIDAVGQPVGQKGGGEIFSKPKIASIEGKNIDLTLVSGTGTGFDVRDASETMNQFIQSADYPVDVLGSNVSDGGYSMLMKKTETEKELINKYAVERSKI